MTKLVALALPAGPLFVDMLQRVWDEGNAIFPLDPRLPPSAAKGLLEALGVTEVVDETGGRHRLPGQSRVQAGDAAVVATSGTTGVPKGVVHTHQSVEASARITSTALGVGADDHWLACLPLSHIGGLSVVTRALLTGTRLTTLAGFDAATVEELGREGVTLTSLVNTALRRIDASAFRRILLGGAAPMSDRPSNVVTTYGMTETGSGVVYNGIALPGVSVKSDASGQLLIQSPTLLRAYTNGFDPKDSDGWFPTGDAGTVSADGLVSVFGRIDDAIVTGGEKVWPSVVEEVLRLHPRVGDALVYSKRDSEWDERVVVDVELSDPNTTVSLEELREYVKEHLPAFHAPRELNVVTALDRTASGKVKRPARATF